MDALNAIVLALSGAILAIAVWLGVKVNVLDEENKALQRIIADDRQHITLIDVNDKRHLHLVKNTREEVMSE